MLIYPGELYRLMGASSFIYITECKITFFVPIAVSEMDGAQSPNATNILFGRPKGCSKLGPTKNVWAIA